MATKMIETEKEINIQKEQLMIISCTKQCIKHKMGTIKIDCIIEQSEKTWLTKWIKYSKIYIMIPSYFLFSFLFYFRKIFKLLYMPGNFGIFNQNYISMVLLHKRVFVRYFSIFLSFSQPKWQEQLIKQCQTSLLCFFDQICHVICFFVNLNQLLICLQFNSNYYSSEMGQISTCTTLSNSPSLEIIETSKTMDVRRSLHPLHYIQPKIYNFDDPCTAQNEVTAKNLISLEQVSKITNIEHSQESDDCGEFKSLDQQDQKEIMYRKIQVKWNKFIKMKRKNFTSDYNIIREIGRGGFGCVFKVIMKNAKIYRAAKRIQKNSLKSDEHKNLLAEMALMMHMDHPNITKLYEVYDQKNSYVLILQLCEGGQLFERIVDHCISENQAKCIMKQILSALHYLHTKGIVHRDIKPENMLFQKSTRLVKIIDFGISTKLELNKPLTSRVGTPYYIAPEVLARRYDEKCDIWSVGIVLYMIIYNFPPFKGENPNTVMHAIMNQQIAYRNPLSFKFSYQALQFLKQLLIKNPNKRPSAQKALRHKWIESRVQLQKEDIDTQKDKVLERITKFHFKNKLEAVVYTYIVSQLLTSEQRLQLLGVFKQLDKNNNGIIEINQLTAALSNKKFFEGSDEKVKLIKQYLDTNCSGFVDYTQFLVGGMDFNEKIDERHFQQAFSYFDIDNSGEITFQEVSKFLENQLATKEEIRELFRNVDKNNDGVISKMEFLQLLVQNKMQKLSSKIII